MAPEPTNPARGEAAGLGKVVHSHATDTRLTNATPQHLQTTWLASRYGFSEHRASLMAELVFSVTPRRA
jgi:hypothetical protein